jgi:hypothetical protein
VKIKCYIWVGEKKKKLSIRQMKGVRWEYALSRYLLISFINVTIGDSNTANSLFTKLNGITSPGLIFAATSYSISFSEEKRTIR